MEGSREMANFALSGCDERGGVGRPRRHTSLRPSAGLEKPGTRKARWDDVSADPDKGVGASMILPAA